MIELGACEITGVIGPMASGKTHLINTWLRSAHPLTNRFVRFDVTGETAGDAQLEHIWASPAQLYRRLQANPYYFRIAYHCGPELEKDFELALKCLWRIPTKEGKLIVADEFHEICPVGETPKYVRTMLRYARHNHLAVIAATQRIADVHKLFTAGCRKIIIYRSDEARDYIAVADRWGKVAADCMSRLRPLLYDDISKNVRQLPQCLVIARGEPVKVYDFESSTYSSISSGREIDAPDSMAVQREDSSAVPEEQSTDESL